MTADEYVPDEEQVRAWCRDGTGDYPDVMDEWLDRFLARVKRDAAREAEAERDRWHSMWRQRGVKHLAAEKRATRAEAQSDIRGRAVVMYRDRARVAEARIKAVRALHTGTRWPGVTDKPICDACDQMWPCATIRALD